MYLTFAMHLCIDTFVHENNACEDEVAFNRQTHLATSLTQLGKHSSRALLK